MLAIDGIPSGELITLATAFLSMLVAGVTVTTLERSARQRNTQRLNDLETKAVAELRRDVDKLQKWREQRRGAEMERQGRSPDLTETSNTRRPGGSNEN